MRHGKLMTMERDHPARQRQRERKGDRANQNCLRTGR
jgi:hypothetical protein